MPVVDPPRRKDERFKRQEQIGDYIVDFVCFAQRLIVEADGSQHVENRMTRTHSCATPMR